MSDLDNPTIPFAPVTETPATPYPLPVQLAIDYIEMFLPEDDTKPMRKLLSQERHTYNVSLACLREFIAHGKLADLNPDEHKAPVEAEPTRVESKVTK